MTERGDCWEARPHRWRLIELWQFSVSPMAHICCEVCGTQRVLPTKEWSGLLGTGTPTQQP